MATLPSPPSSPATSSCCGHLLASSAEAAAPILSGPVSGVARGFAGRDVLGRCCRGLREGHRCWLSINDCAFLSLKLQNICKIEKKEILIDGAVREVMEETGVKDLIVKKNLNHTFHLFSRNGSYKLKKTYWYLMTTSYEGILEPQLDEGISMVEWKTKGEVPDLMEMLTKTSDYFLKKLN